MPLKIKISLDYYNICKRNIGKCEIDISHCQTKGAKGPLSIVNSYTWSTAHTEVTFKPGSFLLVNAVNLWDQFEPIEKYVWGNI